MADARLDDIAVAEVAGDRLRLRGRLDDHEPAHSVAVDLAATRDTIAPAPVDSPRGRRLLRAEEAILYVEPCPRSASSRSTALSTAFTALSQIGVL